MTTNNLTEQWKKGELPKGYYYAEDDGEELIIHIQGQNGSVMGDDFDLKATDWIKPIAPVPSYEEWQTQKECLWGVMEANKILSRKYNNIKVNGNYPDRISKLKSRIKGLTEELEPFTDPYFRGLTTKDIAELAKKSIRLTKQSCEDNARIEKLEELLKNVTDECDIEKQKALLKINELSDLLKEWMHFYPIILYEHEDTLKTKDIVELYDKTREVLK